MDYLKYFAGELTEPILFLGRRPATNLIELVQGLIAIYAFDDGTSTFTCKAYDYAFMLLYSALTLAAAG